MNVLLEEARGHNHHLTQLRRQIHKFPEVGRSLPATKQVVVEELYRLGITPKNCGESGVVAEIRGKGEGKVFLLRADMDALPVREETGLGFAAENGCMHACGHDTHVAMLLGAAKLLADHKDDFCGTVKLLFQPAEEILEGAREMLDCGVLENPKVDAAMMIHIISGDEKPVGSLSVFGPGPNYASADWFRIDIQGRGGHGAQPHMAVSPIVIAGSVIAHLQELVAVGVDAGETAVLSIGELHSGNLSNVIPDTAYLAGTIRTFSEEVRAHIKGELAATVPLLAKAKGGDAEVSFTRCTPCVQSDAAVAQSLLRSAQTLVGENAVDMGVLDRDAAHRVTSSEDFAYIARQVPSGLMWLSAGNREAGYVYPAHHPRADFDEDVFFVGAAAYAQSAMDWLNANCK